MTNPDIKAMLLKRQSECVTELGRRYLCAVRPIYGGKPNDPIMAEPIGSCVLLRFKGAPFLITAAHVFDHHTSTGLGVGPLEGRLVRIKGQFHSTGSVANRANDHYDFAFWRLAEETANALDQRDGFIREDEIAQHEGDMNGRQYVVLGFPLSKNKKTVQRAAKSIKPEPVSYQGMRVERPKLLEELCLSGNDHFLVKRERRTSGYDGTIDNAIGLRGASGGALIDRGPSSLENLLPGTPCYGKLAGIFIEHYDNHEALLFTKIEVILKEMARTFSDLGS